MNNDEVLSELREQTRWLRFLGLQQVRPVLMGMLTTESQRRVYELSDGSRSVREIAQRSGVSPATVSRLWNALASAGLMVESSSYPGRWQQLVSLERLGVEVPGLATARPTSHDTTLAGAKE